MDIVSIVNIVNIVTLITLTCQRLCKRRLLATRSGIIRTARAEFYILTLKIETVEEVKEVMELEKRTTTTITDPERDRDTDLHLVQGRFSGLMGALVGRCWAAIGLLWALVESVGSNCRSRHR